MNDAHEGRLGRDRNAARDSARKAFDTIAAEKWNGAHPLVRLKFAEPARMPFYNARREQTAALAAEASERSSPNVAVFGASAGRPRVHGSERWLESNDHKLGGRADFIDRTIKAIVDYKSGQPTEPTVNGIGAAEERQLRFYAHLAEQNNVAVSRGIIVRGDGRRIEIAITPADATLEGVRARDVLRRYNDAVASGASFEALASPSAAACAHCECIPLCEAFWRSADPTWADEGGVHVEGAVEECAQLRVYGARLVQLRIRRTRGTHPADVAVVEQVPAEWVEVDGSALPAAGAVVRIVNVRPDREGSGVFRPDKAATAVWAV
jgi:hypothetical protein